MSYIAFSYIIIPMKQKIKCAALVLKSRKTGENHRFLSLMTDDHGLVSAKAFGAAGRKSKTGLAAMPFAVGSAELEHDTIQDYWQIREFTPLNQFEAIRSDLLKFYTASLWAETLFSLYGGAGESGELFHLTFMALTALDNGLSDEDTHYTSLQFLARYLYGSGFLPDLKHCSHCFMKLDGSKRGSLDLSGQACCHDCFPETGHAVNPGILRYLQVTLTLPLENVYRFTLAEPVRREALHLMYSCVQQLTGKKLKTLESSGGFL